MRHPGLRAVVALFACCCTIALHACSRRRSSAPESGPLPRAIIVFDVDTLRADHLGWYGYARATSPNLDAFAARSLAFDHAFSQAPNTPPSQSSILSGLYPRAHGMIRDEDRLRGDAVTLAEAMRAAGVATAGFHDGGYLRARFGVGQGFDTWNDGAGQGLEVILPRAMSWLERHRAGDFLLFIHTYDVHSPYDPKPPFQDLFVAGLEPPSPGFTPDSPTLERIRMSHYGPHPETLSPHDLAWAMAKYDAGIRWVDAQFGLLLEHVRRLGLEDRATIVVISDHGEEFQEHGSVLHEKLYSTVTHVPLFIHLPGRGGRRIGELVETVDLMPTLLELVGIAIPPGVQGQSLVPLLEGRPHLPVAAFGESPFFGVSRSIAMGRYQGLLTQQDGSFELYDFVADPGEQVDLAAREPELARRLLQRLRSWDQWVQSGAAKPRAPLPLDEETLRRLEALGYLR